MSILLINYLYLFWIIVYKCTRSLHLLVGENRNQEVEQEQELQGQEQGEPKAWLTGCRSWRNTWTPSPAFTIPTCGPMESTKRWVSVSSNNFSRKVIIYINNQIHFCTKTTSIARIICAVHQNLSCSNISSENKVVFEDQNI